MGLDVCLFFLAVMRLRCLGSGGRDVRGLHNDTCAHLVVVARRQRRVRVLVVGGRPGVTVVADEGVGVPRAGDPEVGLVRADERGHARERARGPEKCRLVAPPQDGVDTLSVKTVGKQKMKKRKPNSTNESTSLHGKTM